MKKLRVLVFGSTGVGKTSLCNTLTGKNRPTDNGAKGITSKTHLYAPFTTDSAIIEIIDTVGLHESVHGTVPADMAVMELVSLLEKSRDGFNLLIQVSRASRTTHEHDQDYEFFVKKMADNRIPVILVATGCENESPMQNWAIKNQEALSRFSYKTIVGACLAAGGPLEQHYAPLRELSKVDILSAIISSAAPESIKIYGPEASISFSDKLFSLWNEFVAISGLSEKYRRKVNESSYQLLKRLGVPQAIADAAVKHIPDLAEELGSKLPIPGSGKFARLLAKIGIEKITSRM